MPHAPPHCQPNQSQVHGHQSGLKWLLFAEGRGKTRDPEMPRAASGLSRKLMHPLFSRLESLNKALTRVSLQLGSSLGTWKSCLSPLPK